jgi:hypothetical protein
MNIAQEVNNYEMIYDRYPSQLISLPYSLEEIKIQPNDTVNSDVINLKLQHLYENFLYIYTRSKIASNIIPISSTAVLGMSTYFTYLAWNYNLSSSEFKPVTWSLPDAFNNIKTIHAISSPDLGEYSIFGSNGKTLFIVRSTNTESEVLSTSVITQFNTPASNNVSFTNIEAITDGPDQSILVLDSGNNSLYQYEAKGYTQDNNVFFNRLVFKNLLGGYGSADDKLSFNAPTDVVAYNGNIYVLDTGNSCVKKYDQNLNWVSTYRLNRDFLNTPPKKLTVDAGGNFFCLLSGNRINIYSPNFQQKTEVAIDYLNKTETIIDIVFSKTDANIYYVVTNENIYKGLVNNPGNTIGKYLLYLHRYNDTQTISAFTSIGIGNNDRNLIVSKNPSTNAQIIGAFYDNINLYDILSIPNFDIYTMNDISIKPDEYVQSWVINKSLVKLVTNHLRFIEQIIGKFQFKFDSRRNSVFQFTRYLTAREQTNLTQRAEIL